MTAKGAFAGLKLSGELPGGAPSPVDQRLFAPRPQGQETPAPEPSKVSKAATEQVTSVGPVVRVHGKLVAGPGLGAENSLRRVPLDSAHTDQPLTEPDTRSSARFDINEKPWRKDSFLFTDAEFERLEDLKLDLRRRFDLKATKNDIARAALQHVAEDYQREPDRSAVVRYLRKKKP